MQEHEVIERIKALCDARSWTFYRLAKESGITYSTLCTMLHKSNAPSLPTLIRICDGFGITLAQFFDDNNDQARLTDEQKNLLCRWDGLSKENRLAAEKYISYLLSQQENDFEK